MKKYEFPSHYPKNCPPTPYNEMCGTYYRVAVNKNKLDRFNYKSYYERNLRLKSESTHACERRAISMFTCYEMAVNLLRQFPNIGEYIARLDLIGGHGVVKANGKSRGHCNWWIPIGVDPSRYCSEITNPEP